MVGRTSKAVEDLKNRVEFPYPNDELICIIYRGVESRDRDSLTLIDNILLHLYHDPDFELGCRAVQLTYSAVELPRSSNPLQFKPRSRVVNTEAQVDPR